jgi:hypothetical protein
MVQTNQILRSGDKITKKTFIYGLALAMSAMSVFSSCTKDEAVKPQALNDTKAPTPITPGATVAFTTTTPATTGSVNRSLTGNVYTVFNFNQGAPSEYYYKFSINDGASSTTADIIFDGTSHADFSVKSGYTLKYKSVNFDTVTTDAGFTTIATGKAGYNRISTGAPNWTIDPLHVGWYNYNITDHIAYPLIENGVYLTFIVITDTGVKYKVEMQDIYQNRTPAGGPPPSNFPYVHFRYKQI